MTILINGRRTQLTAPTTLADLLRRFELASAPCAVEVNEVLVPKQDHASRTVAEGDVVEIVTLVGGG